MISILVDLTDTTNGTGFIDSDSLSAYRDSDGWHVVAGDMDQHRGNGKTLRSALQNMARSSGFLATVQVARDFSSKVDSFKIG